MKRFAALFLIGCSLIWSGCESCYQCKVTTRITVNGATQSTGSATTELCGDDAEDDQTQSMSSYQGQTAVVYVTTDCPG